MSKEAMKMALEYLINLQPILGNGLLEERQLAFIDPHIDCAIIALREALAEQPAQPQQEPVAQYIGECSEGSLVHLYDDVKKGTNLYTSPPAQRKPLTYEQRNTIISQECRYTSEAATEDHHHLIEAVELLHNIKENT